MIAQNTVLYGLLAYGEAAWQNHAGSLDADLFDEPLRTVYRAIEDLHSEQRVVDAVTVVERLGIEYNDMVMQVMQSWVSDSTLGAYITELQRNADEAKARQIGQQLTHTGDVEAATSALAGLGDRSAQAETIDGKAAVRALWQHVTDRVDQDHIGLDTGLNRLDDLLGGLCAGDLVLIAARPSRGKTCLMLNIAKNVPCPVGIFSLEMPTEKLMARLISSCGIDHGKLKRPKDLTDEDWQKMTHASQQIQDGLFINDVGGLSISALESEARRMVKNGVGLICVDYLQLVTCKAEKRYEVVSEVSRRLKALAKNLCIPIIALSQLNRESEGKINPKLALSQLRESGQLEQDADIVIFIERPCMRDPQHRPGEADLTIAKNRDGECGTVKVAFQGHFQRFTNLAYDSYPRSVA